MRCLTLAEYLRNRGATVLFVTRDLGGLDTLVGEKGFPFARLTELTADESIDEISDAAATTEASRKFFGRVAEWIVVDHYQLSERWERTVRAAARKIMAIDDLADRPHDCDLLLDQNYHFNAVERYRGLIVPSCVQLLGPSYALLRDEFRRATRGVRDRSGGVKRIFVSFGSTDPTGETAKVLSALVSIWDAEIPVDVVMGTGSPSLKQIRAQCQEVPRVTLHIQPARMADLMFAADLAIGGAGATTWERCCLGLPSLAIALAENQISIAQSCERAGALIYLGTSSEVSAVEIAARLRELVRKPEALEEMASKARALVDGLGVHRVCTAMLR